MQIGNCRLPCAEHTLVGLWLLIAVLAPSGAAAEVADGRPLEVPVRGVVRSTEQASISTELATRVSAVHAREGEAFNAGDKLLEFDCRRQKATLAASEAQQLEMQLSVDKNRLLLRTQSVGKNDLEVSEARLAKAKAESDALRSPLDQCVVIAPFKGRVLELNLQLYETSQPGKPFIGLVSNSRLEIDLIVPSHWVRKIATGTPLKFRVDELGRSVEAMVGRIGAAVDPVSQTVKVIATFDNSAEAVLPGMSGIATFPKESE